MTKQRLSSFAQGKLFGATFLPAALLILAGCVLAAFSLTLGDVCLTFPEALQAARGHGAPGNVFIVRSLRLPAIWGAIIVGVGLGVAGALTQSILRNPLASPDILGITSGASTFAVLSLAVPTSLTTHLSLFTGVGLPLSAAFGGIAAGCLVFLISWKGNLSVNRLILVGLGVNAGFGALTSWLLLHIDLPSLSTSLTWLTGSLNQIPKGSLPLVGTTVFLGLTLAIFHYRNIAILRFDPRIANALGVAVLPTAIALLLLAASIAALVTAIAGPVPFIAFAAPQVALRIFRSEGPPVIGSALVGAFMMLAAHLAASHLLSTPLPVGIATSFLGIPILVWLLIGRGSRTFT